MPSGAAPLARSLVGDPSVARYYVGFGTKLGDLGRIAEDGNGHAMGAAWVRYSTTDDPSYGSVDDDTPELGIAVVSGARGGGIGRALLDLLLVDLDRCSLSVDRRNPAMRLSERCGFVELRRDGDSVFMLHQRPH